MSVSYPNKLLFIHVHKMIKKEGHDFSVDYYGLGALLYEMIFGFPPYYTQNTNKMFSDIMNKQLCFPN